MILRRLWNRNRDDTSPLAPARVDVESTSEHSFSWWHQGVFLFDADYPWDDTSAYEQATADGGAFGQSRDNAVTFISPGGAVFGSENAPLTLQLRSSPPHELDPEAESVADFDLQLPSGQLVFEGSGGDSPQTPITVPPGRWRARWSGYGELAAEATQDDPPATRPDRYCLRMWPATTAEVLTVYRTTSS